jgi:hypothetical protein
MVPTENTNPTLCSVADFLTQAQAAITRVACNKHINPSERADEETALVLLQ